MAQPTVRISLHIAWWLRWYLAGVVTMSRTTGRQPDMGKVKYWANRAIKVVIE